MDAADQGYFRERLLREREELKQQIKTIEETGLAVPLRDATGELALYDNHPADVASEVFERSKDLALKEDAELRLGAIEDALSRMEQGRYGYCDICGAAIPFERLAAVPYTTVCQRCKGEQEKKERKRVRPVEEEVLRNPWARAGDESVVYDEEDAWQDVAQHGLSTETEPLEEEDRGAVEDVDEIPYYKSNGVTYRDYRPKR
uniref:Conjugal transfer protein TraR n=1 Tax=Ammonifex degensii TaxID=42838 RepID=A0A7C2ICS2_9THEO